ncbi:hypothetical protein Vadar_011793 [Vaccinium darrowii]|uniref:Uncharacterized protein n=1 Tax=Vaccinium darrowii TaxID=229202 RepID=A0ACB7X9B2_9ERIC|nr:hypothetical protein Vadar_011793 [Vaccinium darrowii]
MGNSVVSRDMQITPPNAKLPGDRGFALGSCTPLSPFCRHPWQQHLRLLEGFIAPAKGNCTAEFDSFGSVSNVFTLSWSHGMLAEHHRGMCNQHLAGSGSMLFSVICATMYLIWDKDGKTFKKRRHPYEKQQLDAELKLVGEYGLQCKRELWRVQYALSRIRNAARMLLTLDEKNQHRVFEGEALLNENQNKLDYVLALTVENFLEHRLQRAHQTGISAKI